MARGVLDEPDLELSGAVARKVKGEDAGQVLGRAAIGLAVADSVEAALEAGGTQVYIDYTHPSAVKANVLAALNRGVPAIVGTSGLSRRRLCRDRQGRGGSRPRRGGERQFLDHRRAAAALRA